MTILNSFLVSCLVNVDIPSWMGMKLETLVRNFLYLSSNESKSDGMQLELKNKPENSISSAREKKKKKQAVRVTVKQKRFY